MKGIFDILVSIESFKDMLLDVILILESLLFLIFDILILLILLLLVSDTEKDAFISVVTIYGLISPIIISFLFEIK